jgi:hypothetical protein
MSQRISLSKCSSLSFGSSSVSSGSDLLLTCPLEPLGRSLPDDTSKGWVTSGSLPIRKFRPAEPKSAKQVPHFACPICASRRALSGDDRAETFAKVPECREAGSASRRQHQGGNGKGSRHPERSSLGPPPRRKVRMGQAERGTCFLVIAGHKCSVSRSPDPRNTTHACHPEREAEGSAVPLLSGSTRNFRIAGQPSKSGCTLVVASMSDSAIDRRLRLYRVISGLPTIAST